jgi:tripeptidyl-peptidase-1
MPLHFMLTLGHRYHIPSSVREHVDYITPGIALREVTGVGKSSNSRKRSVDGIPPILEPILMPIEKLVTELTSFCSHVVTPQCIQGMLWESNWLSMIVVVIY